MKFLYLVLGSAALLAAAMISAIFELSRPRPRAITPRLGAQPEYCVTCHSKLPEISAAHPIETFGCVRCHGGERLALDADLAHSTMRGGANPSDFSVVEKSCGGSECHSGSEAERRDHIQRATASIQSTYAGGIATILYTLGAQPDLKARYAVSPIRDDSITTSTGVAALEEFVPSAFGNAFIRAFGANCLTCHINAEPGDAPQAARFTGCAACHSPMSGTGGERETHVLATAIPYTQCNTCHNRGNYNLRMMAFVPRSDQPANRLEDYYQPIAQFVRCEYTLDCIDCHTRVEAMGDGDLHSSKKEIQYVQCKTCHGTLAQRPATTDLHAANNIAFRLSQLNPIVEPEIGDEVLVTDKGEPLWNTRVLPDGTYELIGKATGEHFQIRPVMGSRCTQKPDEQASQYCHECHAVER